MHHQGGRLVAGAALGLAIVLAVIAHAVAGDVLNTDERNVAIMGYDPVAYFVQNQPVKGSPQFEHVWQDARWHFASAEHRQMFAADPLAYAPRYGGFCSGAMTRGFRAPIDPEAWAIVDGKLYLAFAQSVIDRFTSEAAENIDKADAAWEGLETVE